MLIGVRAETLSLNLKTPSESLCFPRQLACKPPSLSRFYDIKLWTYLAFLINNKITDIQAKIMLFWCTTFQWWQADLRILHHIQQQPWRTPNVFSSPQDRLSSAVTWSTKHSYHSQNISDVKKDAGFLRALYLHTGITSFVFIPPAQQRRNTESTGTEKTEAWGDITQVA